MANCHIKEKMVFLTFCKGSKSKEKEKYILSNSRFSHTHIFIREYHVKKNSKILRKVYS